MYINNQPSDIQHASNIDLWGNHHQCMYQHYQYIHLHKQHHLTSHLQNQPMCKPNNPPATLIKVKRGEVKEVHVTTIETEQWCLQQYPPSNIQPSANTNNIPPTGARFDIKNGSNVSTITVVLILQIDIRRATKRDAIGAMQKCTNTLSTNPVIRQSRMISSQQIQMHIRYDGQGRPWM